MDELGRCYVEQPGVNSDSCIYNIKVARYQWKTPRFLSYLTLAYFRLSPSLESTLAHAFAVQHHEFQWSLRVATSAGKARDLEKIVGRGEL